MQLVDIIATAIDNADYLLGIFLGFCIAFDTVIHRLLLIKLAHCGIREQALVWFERYYYGNMFYWTKINQTSKLYLMQFNRGQY